MNPELSKEEVKEFYKRLERDAAGGAYNLNPDVLFTTTLVEGLLTNRKRYGYALCPCRLTGGTREADLDIICPCDYRDADLDDYDTCF